MPRSTRSPLTFSYLLIALLLGLMVSLTACVGPAEAPPPAPADDTAAQNQGDSPAEAEASLAGNADNGQTIHTTYCLGCHSRDGTDAIGPSIVGLVPRAEEIIASADYSGQASNAQAYIRESIEEPNVHVVSGYAQGVMPSYSQTLSNQELADLVAYLLTYE